MTDFQRERLRSPKRRRLDASPISDQEPELEDLNPFSTQVGHSPSFRQLNTASPSWVLSPTHEPPQYLQGFDTTLGFPSPASLTSVADTFEVQVERLTDQFVGNPGSLNNAIHLTELLRSRLDDDEMIDFWKGMVLRTLRGRSQAPKMLSLVFKSKGSPEDALEFWKEMVLQHPETVNYAKQLTNTFLSMSNNAGAIEFWRSMIRTIPSSKAGLSIAYRELAMCEVDSDPNICVATLKAIHGRLSRRCIYDIGRAMSRPNRVHHAMEVYRLLRSSWHHWPFRDGVLAGLRGDDDRKAAVEILKTFPVPSLAIDFLRSTYMGSDEPEALRFWFEQYQHDSGDVTNICQFAQSLQRTGDLDRAIAVCTPSNHPRVISTLSELLKAKGGRSAVLEYWNSFERPLPPLVMEYLTAACLHTMGPGRVVELCHAALSKSGPLYGRSSLCSSVQKVFKEQSGWDLAIQIWESLIANHPEYIRDVAYFLIEALLERNDITRVVEVYNKDPNATMSSDVRIKIMECLADTGGINAAIEFCYTQLSRANRYDLYEESRFFQLRLDRQEALQFWKRAYQDIGIPGSIRNQIIGELTSAFGNDYDGLTDFWRQIPPRDGFSWEKKNLRSLTKAIRAKKDTAFETRFWTIIFDSNPHRVDLLPALASALRRANLDTNLESFRSLLAETPTSNVLQQEIAHVFEKKGDIDGEIEFWKRAVSQHPEVNSLRNRLMRLFKRRGDVNQAMSFWTDMVSREPLHWYQRYRRRKLSEAKKWKKEVDSAVNFRSLSSRGQ